MLNLQMSTFCAITMEEDVHRVKTEKKVQRINLSRSYRKAALLLTTILSLFKSSVNL